MTEDPTQDPNSSDAGNEESAGEDQPVPEEPKATTEEGAAEEPAVPEESSAEEQPEEVAAGDSDGVAADADKGSQEGGAGSAGSGREAEQPADVSGEQPADVSAAPGADLEPIRLEEERELSAEERARLEAEQEERAQREAALTDEAEAEEPVRAAERLDLPADARIQATGKRKTAVARVVLAPGGGNLRVNRRELAEYFPRSYHQTVARQALATSGYEDQLDVTVRVHGGGASGQADAVRHGIARALVEIDPELRGELKRRGMLTRDARAKERRKAGLKKARKRPQFSKR